MPLIKCHECSGQVSDHARTCPKCGAPVIATIKRRQKAYLMQLAVNVVFTAIMLIVIYFTVHHLFDKLLAPLKAHTHQQESH